MTGVSTDLSHAVGIAFTLLGVAATAGWLRRRDRSRAWLAAALGLLGFVSLLGEVTVLTGVTVPGAVQLGIAAFAGSGLALVELRHHLVPLRRGAHRLTIAAVAVVTLLALAVPLPAAPGAHYSALQVIVVLALVVLWAGCVSGPAITFWQAARQRPAVQRARLRALAAGYLGLVAVLLLAVGAGSGGAVDGTPLTPPLTIAIEVLLLAMVPVLYCSFAPPCCLRRAWRSHEEAAFRHAVHDLLIASADEESLCVRALDWATRLVGADAGVLLSPTGRLVSTPGMGDARARELAAVAPPPDRSATALAEGDRLIAALHGETADGVLVLVAGPFSPFLGGSEARRLAEYATLVDAALVRVRTLEVLAAAARRDPLTGVANRRAWEEELEHAISRARHDGEPLSVAVLDLDNFKTFNDDWGHPRGDRLLRDVARAWSHALRAVDVIARYGGDEFALIMPGCSGADARAALQRLRELTPERQQASGGVAEWDTRETAEELVGRADAALFEAKRTHRGSIALAASGAGGDHFTGWSRHIGRLLTEQRLRAAYQPICRLADGSVFAYEALARPESTDAHGSVEELFAAAHRLGLTRDLDWLSRKVAVWDARLLPESALLFVNVSGSALLDPVHDVDQMLLLLETTGRRPDRVVLEISEREAISDLRRLREVLACYRREGFRFALDDVGEGHSTLEVLAAADAEFIKLAGSLTRRIHAERTDPAIRAIVTFASATGASLVAEGVEDAGAAVALRRLGIELGQGFALGRPAFPGTIAELHRELRAARAV